MRAASHSRSAVRGAWARILSGGDTQVPYPPLLEDKALPPLELLLAQAHVADMAGLSLAMYCLHANQTVSRRALAQCLHF